MADLADDIGDLTLATVVLPGTHDSGTYGVTSDYAPEECQYEPLTEWVASWQETCEELPWPINWACDLIVPHVSAAAFTKAWAQAQDQSIYSQLEGGIRFFDLRFFKHDDGKFYIHHTLLGPDSEEIFNDVRQFIDESGHEREIVVLQLMHWCQDGQPPGMDWNAHSAFISHLQDKFHNRLIPPERVNDRLSDLWADGQQVVIVYKDCPQNLCPAEFWTNRCSNVTFAQSETKSLFGVKIDKMG